MSDELLALGVTAVLAAAIVAARFARAERARITLAVALASAVAAATVWSTARRLPLLAGRAVLAEEKVTTRPIEELVDGYVSSSKCRACHPHEYDTWDDSYHRKMTRRADAASVLGNFDNVQAMLDGRMFHLQRRGDEFWVEMDNPMPATPNAPARVSQRIALVTGSHHMQAYWFESGHTRTLGLLPLTWQIAEQRWISRRSAFVMPPTDPIDPALGAWSMLCLKCHATHARPRIDYEGNLQRGHDTRVAEFGIACEACHGPADAHVAESQNPANRYALHLGDTPSASIVNPARLDPQRANHVCGQCHGIFDYGFEKLPRVMNDWLRDGFRYRPGDDVLQHRTAKFSGDEQFWSDGLVRVAGREYNAMVGSGCHDRGALTCMSCHVMHQPHDDPRPRDEWANDQLHAVGGDQSCLQCHAQYGADIAAHTHHGADSAGSRCMNCHMPHTTYGLMKGVRTHRIASPTVQSSLATGRPNACNQCHLDQTLEWTAQRLHEWYGTPVPELGSDDRTIAASVRWALKGDAAQRALMAWSFGWPAAREASGTGWLAPYLGELLEDPYEVVRIIAERSLRTLPGYEASGAPGAGAQQGARSRVLALWQQQTKVGDARGPRVLIQPDGTLRTDTWTRLLRERDLRPVRLFE